MGNYIERNSSPDFVNDNTLLSWFNNENEQIMSTK